MIKKLLNKFSLSDNARSMLAGMGSVFSFYVPPKNFFNRRSVPSNGLCRNYSYKNPTTMHDYWKDTGKFLSWAMNSYEQNESKNLKKK